MGAGASTDLIRSRLEDGHDHFNEQSDTLILTRQNNR